MNYATNELCGYCHKPLYPLGQGGAYHPDKDGPSYHGLDCWPRERFRRDGTPFITCRECGKAEANGYAQPTKNRMKDKSLCFYCNFWDEWVERDAKGDDSAIVRIAGCHYHIGEESFKNRHEFRGFGGRRFAIHFLDGRNVISTNLWYQGEIPQHFRDRLPDNAEWAQPS